MRRLLYSASHSRVAPENVGLQKELKYNTCNEVRLCVWWIRKKEVGNTACYGDSFILWRQCVLSVRYELDCKYFYK
jgi:hypothetical protein